MAWNRAHRTAQRSPSARSTPHCAQARPQGSRPGSSWAWRLAALCFALVASLGSAPAALALDPLSYIVIDADTGHVLRSSRSNRARHPASLTKMMTLYLTFEALEARRLRPDQVLIASRKVAAQPPSELGLKVGDKVTVREAVRAAAVKSANDAAVILAEAIGGTEKAFARIMTSKARELGMADTTFKNASGLTASGHRSTAHDMAILARRLYMDFPDYYHLFSKERVRLRGHTYRNTNRLLGAPGVDGIKTGYTRAAGHNLAASARRGGKRVIVILLSGRSSQARYDTVATLLKDGFDRIKKNESKGLLVAVRAAPRPSANPQREPDPGEMRVVAASAKRDAAGVMRGGVLKGWSVQVGAFLDPVSAKAHLQKVLALHTPGLGGGFRQLQTAKLAPASGKRAVTVHRVRFNGLSEEDARSACRHLEEERIDCALVPPIGWDSRRVAMR